MKRSTLLSVLATLLFAGSLPAASDYLLELDGIKGESTDERHKDTIEIQSFTWGVTRSIPSQPGSVGKTTFSDLTSVSFFSKATPQILTAVASGKLISKAVLYGRKAGADKPHEYLRITLENVLISSLQQSGSTGNGGPTDQFSLNFTSLLIEHIAEDGTVTPSATVVNSQ